MPHPQKLVIFDLDGTLVDSMWIWRDIDEEYLARYGLTMPPNLQQDIGGISITQTAIYFQKRFGIKDSIEKMIADWDEMAMHKYKYEIPLKDGIMTLLKALSDKQIPCGIATSSSNALTKAVLEARHIDGFFSAVVTGEDIHNGKPNPEIYEICAKKLGVDPQRCIAFEDMVCGIQAAKGAGMRVCAVEDDFSVKDREEKKRLADFYICSYKEIIDEIDRELK